MITETDFIIEKYNDDPTCTIIKIPRELSQYSHIEFSVYPHGILIYFNHEVIILHVDIQSIISFSFDSREYFRELEFYNHCQANIQMSGIHCYSVEFNMNTEDSRASILDSKIENLLMSPDTSKFKKLTIYDCDIRFNINLHAQRMIIKDVKIRMIKRCHISVLRVWESTIYQVKSVIVDNFATDEKSNFHNVYDLRFVKNTDSYLHIIQGTCDRLFHSITFTDEMVNYFIGDSI